MSNDFYNATGYPGDAAFGSSADMRGELALIARAFDKFPAPAGNAGKVMVSNGSDLAFSGDATFSVADYPALRAYGGSAGHVLVTGPGITGVFGRDAADTTTPDDGAIVIVSASGVRWKRRYEGPVDAAWFGVPVDDVVSDSTAELQAWATYTQAHRVGAAACYGRFRITSQVSFVGNGSYPLTNNFIFGAEIRCDFSVESDAILFTGVPYLYIGGHLYLNGNGTSTTSGFMNWADRKVLNGITVHNCSGFSGDDFDIYNVKRHAMRITGLTAVARLGRCRFWYCGASRINTPQGCTVNYTAVSETGSSNSTNQRAVLTVDSVPAGLVANSTLCRIGSSVHQITAFDATAMTITVYPWLDTSATTGQMALHIGGGFLTEGIDTSVGRIEVLDTLGCGVGLENRSLYPTSVGSHTAQACGIGHSLGSGPASACVGGSVQHSYMEINDCDICQVTSVVMGFRFGTTSALTPDKLHKIAPRTAGTRVQIYTFSKFAGITLGYNGREHRDSQVNPGSFASGILNMSPTPTGVSYLSAYSNSQSINLLAEAKLSELFGDTNCFLMARGTSGAGGPTGTYTFTPEAGYTINGGAAGAALAFSNLNVPTLFHAQLVGVDWKLFALRQDTQSGAVSADRGDAAVTLLAGTDVSYQRFVTPLTADRAVTLSTTGAWNGARFKIIRDAAATGAFKLNVGTGPLQALDAGQSCEVVYDGSGWRLADYGLPGHTYPEKVAYLKTLSDIANGSEVSIHRWMTKAQIDNALADTGSIDVSAAWQDAFTNYSRLTVDRGKYLLSSAVTMNYDNARVDLRAANIVASLSGGGYLLNFGSTSDTPLREGLEVLGGRFTQSNSATTQNANFIRVSGTRDFTLAGQRLHNVSNGGITVEAGCEDGDINDLIIVGKSAHSTIRGVWVNGATASDYAAQLVDETSITRNATAVPVYAAKNIRVSRLRAQLAGYGVYFMNARDCSLTDFNIDISGVGAQRCVAVNNYSPNMTIRRGTLRSDRSSTGILVTQASDGVLIDDVLALGTFGGNRDIYVQYLAEAKIQNSRFLTDTTQNIQVDMGGYAIVCKNQFRKAARTADYRAVFVTALTSGGTTIGDTATSVGGVEFIDNEVSRRCIGVLAQATLASANGNVPGIGHVEYRGNTTKTMDLAATASEYPLNVTVGTGANLTPYKYVDNAVMPAVNANRNRAVVNGTAVTDLNTQAQFARFLVSVATGGGAITITKQAGAYFSLGASRSAGNLILTPRTIAGAAGSSEVPMWFCDTGGTIGRFQCVKSGANYVLTAYDTAGAAISFATTAGSFDVLLGAHAAT